MRITLRDIQDAFSDLESGAKSREEIAGFASNAMRANDAGLLCADPSTEARRIWQAVTYLSGVDIRVTPDRYLHCVEDFIAFRATIGIGIWKATDAAPSG